MSHLNRAASGTGGGPPALSAPLLNNGLKSSRPGRPSLSAETINSILEKNAIISNVDYHEKLQTLQTVFSGPNSTSTVSLVLYLVSPTANPDKIRTDLDTRYGFKSLSYIPETSVSGLDYPWFKDLRNGLAIVPIQDMILALDRGLIDLSVSSHLVLDDAHSIVLDGLSAPLGTFLLEYYGKLVNSKRPRILGFTRYPLEQKSNFGYLALRMEQLLDARVLGDLQVRRQEVEAETARLPISILEYTPPHSQGASGSTGREEYHPALRSTCDELGESCGAVLQQLPFDWDTQGIIKCKPFPKIDPPGPNVGTTSKFEVLLNYLRRVSQEPDFRCVIIASNPFTVLVLEWLLSSNQQAGLRVSTYVDHLQMNHDYSDRETLLDGFLTGSINTLICDNTVLADMDDGVCSHVIWFNPYSSLIALAQSRRLARRSNANLILLAEQNNRECYRAARDVLRMEPVVTNWMLGMNIGGAPIPPPSIAFCPRYGAPVLIGISNKSAPEPSYILDPFTGARIYRKDSEEVLYRFLATQSNSHYAVLPVKIFSYTTSADEGLWRCIINVSSCNPPLNVSGDPSSSKAIARGSACLCACAALFKLGSLPSTLFPLRPVNFWNHGILQRGTDGPASRADYPIVFPLFWHNCLLSAPSKVFHPAVINFTAVSGSETYKSMLLLTRQSLPRVEEFSVFPSQTEFKVALRQYPSIILGTEQLELIFRYTIYLWRILTNKPFESPSGELAYFVAPIRGDVNLELNDPGARIVEEFISWDEVNCLVSSRVHPLNCTNSNSIALDLKAGVIQDRSHEFTRRFENGELRSDLNPLSPVVQEQGTGPYMSILDYYRTHRHEFEGIKNLQQPLIEATLLPGLVNNLDPKESLVALTKNYLVPEMCSVSSIPASTFHTASLIPSIIWHIEGVLIAKEMNLTFFQGQIREELLMHALCSQAARRTFNYERLEFLGDTFIKYAASVYLYGTEPHAAAGLLHTRRQKMVNNRTLCQGARAVGLPSCIQSEPFRPKFWAIPNASVSRRTQAPTGSSGDQELGDKVNRRLQSRQIADKVVADVVEAIIGAALLSGGESLGFSAAKTLGFDSPRTGDWLDVTAFTPDKPNLIREPQDKDTLRGIMKIVGVPLHNPEILLQAIHHPSLTSLSESYERLEFLGDAVLDMLVVQSFFSDDEKWSPHNMTLIKSSMVSNRALAIICVESGLHRYLKHDAPQLTKHIKSFVEEIEKCKRVAKTDSQRLRAWSTLQAPKALGDVVESLLGAIYVSSDFRLSRVKAVYDRLLKPFYDRYIDKKAMLSHPMSQLMAKLESVGCRALGLVKTALPCADGNTYVTKCEVKVHGRVIAEATSERPKQAIAQATQEAYDHLEHKPNYLSQNCTCNPAVPGKKRKRPPPEEGEIVEPLAGDDADHPIDVDMFDF